MYMQVQELVLMGRMGRMGALQLEQWQRECRGSTRDRKHAFLYFNPVMCMQVRELVLMGRMGALQPELWQWKHG